jgi:hypothetical protein
MSLAAYGVADGPGLVLGLCNPAVCGSMMTGLAGV